MLSISSLLNPESPSSEKPGSNKGAPPASSHSQPTTTRRPSTKPKRRRATKNTPEHSQAPPMPHILNEQEIRFPPHEVTSMEGRDACMKFSVMPEGNLGFPKHIPYSSTKAPRLQPARKTGFHVFQFTFRMLNEEKEHIVMWDCHAGLVKTTAFFRALKYPKVSKPVGPIQPQPLDLYKDDNNGHMLNYTPSFIQTAPTKTIDANPGLRELCYNITGGSLLAQGYWMPFEIAKALAATFCWELRYILAIIFGGDFPSLCKHPDDPSFGRMVVSQDLIAKVSMEQKRSVLPSTPDSIGTSESSPPHVLSSSSSTGLNREKKKRKARDDDTVSSSGERYFYWHQRQHQHRHQHQRRKQQQHSPTSTESQVSDTSNTPRSSAFYTTSPSSREETLPPTSATLQPELPSFASRPTTSASMRDAFSPINGSSPRCSSAPSTSGLTLTWRRAPPSHDKSPKKRKRNNEDNLPKSTSRSATKDVTPDSSSSSPSPSSSPNERRVQLTPADLNAARVLLGMPHDVRNQGVDRHPRVEELVDEERSVADQETNVL